MSSLSKHKELCVTLPQTAHILKFQSAESAIFPQNLGHTNHNFAQYTVYRKCANCKQATIPLPTWQLHADLKPLFKGRICSNSQTLCFTDREKHCTCPTWMQRAVNSPPHLHRPVWMRISSDSWLWGRVEHCTLTDCFLSNLKCYSHTLSM